MSTSTRTRRDGTPRTGTHHVERVMGMPVSIDIRDDLGARAPEAVAEVVEWLHLVNDTWSTHSDDSPITRFARGELTADELPMHMHRVLDRCEELSALTNGAFSIHVPAPNGTMLETSGYIKGWAVQQAAELLAVHGARNFTINAGGDIAVRGAVAPGSPWRIGLRHPRRADALADVLELRGPCAVATSGCYERGRHITDPRTGQPAESLASVTIVGQDLAFVDVAATAVFVMGPEGLLWAMDHGLEGMAITTDGDCLSTPGYEALRAVG